MFKKALYIIFVLWLLILAGRSFQYVYRVYMEFKYPEPDRTALIDVCQSNPNFSSYQDEYLYNYLKIGKICKKP